MIESISSWAQSIIISVIIVTIIEMILPNKSNNKKYIQMIGGIFILFTIASPIIKSFGNTNDLEEKILKYEQYFENENTMKIDSNKIEEIKEEQTKQIYIASLKQNIQHLLEENDYVIEDIKIDLKDNNVENLEMKISSNKIKKVDISKNNENISNEEINKIKEKLSYQYGITENKIKINED